MADTSRGYRNQFILMVMASGWKAIRGTIKIEYTTWMARVNIPNYLHKINTRLDENYPNHRNQRGYRPDEKKFRETR
jgi:hypothetical protein